MSQRPTQHPVYFMDFTPGNPDTLILNGRHVSRCPPPTASFYFPPGPQHIVAAFSQAGGGYYSISNPAYCHSDQIWIRSIQGARHHLEAQSFFYRPHSPLSELISLALYDWEHLNALQRDPAEANPMRLTGAIAERLLSRIEELEHSVSQSVSHLEDS